MFNKANYSVVLDLSSLLLRCHLLSGNIIMCCKPFSANISIIIKEVFCFSSSLFEGFSEGISCLLWLNDLCGWFFSWDSYMQWLINKTFEFQAFWFFSNTHKIQLHQYYDNPHIVPTHRVIQGNEPAKSFPHTFQDLMMPKL